MGKVYYRIQDKLYEELYLTASLHAVLGSLLQKVLEKSTGPAVFLRRCRGLRQPVVAENLWRRILAHCYANYPGLDMEDTESGALIFEPKRGVRFSMQPGPE